jgi:hypothetical protein
VILTTGSAREAGRRLIHNSKYLRSRIMPLKRPINAETVHVSTSRHFSDFPCRLNRSMQHYRNAGSDNISPGKRTCLALLA